jgi:hypothetical protein
MTAEIVNSAAHLFRPRDTYRFRGVTPSVAPSYDPTAGQNPPYGADINYYLKSSPAEDVQVTIIDDKGQTVRTLRGSKEPGLNRVWWDLRYPPAVERIRVLTSPIYASWLRPEEETRGGGGGRMALLAPPGNYTVKLTVGVQEFTQPLKVIKDPHSAGTETDIRVQFALLEAISKNMNSVARMVNQVESIRRQVEDLQSQRARLTEVSTAASTLDQKLIAFEENLRQLRNTGGQDGTRWPAKLLEKLSHLYGIAEEGDFAPTDQDVAVNRQYSEQIASLQGQLQGLLSNDLAAFNRMLAQQNLGSIVTAAPKTTRGDRE